MESLRKYAAEHFARYGAELDFAGDVAVSQAMIPAVVDTQINSLMLALALSWGTVALLLRSVRSAFLAILPSTVAALWVMGALGWLGIPLGVATSMFFVITLGIGVDYAVHFIEGVRRRGVDGALAEVGPAIVVDTLALALGFGLLTVSSVPANARLGLLVALALVAGCVLTLGGLGAVMQKKARA
jgi:predicted RND superfamily exporter protein